jgi:hypothetical protein
MNAAQGPVYVLYPRGVRTGGPEAMHQLVDSLRRQGREAYLVPRPGTAAADRVAAYDAYDAPEAPEVRDVEGAAVVTAEDAPMLLSAVRRAQPYVWWLSVDNSTRFRDERRLLNRATVAPIGGRDAARARAAMLWHELQRRRSGETALLDRVNHLAQSQFAWSYLFSRLSVLPSKLTDYTDLSSFSDSPPVDRDRSIAYNPTKSRELMDSIRQRLPDVRYVKLENLDRRGLLDALEGVAVYLDLGNHPGKDRLPREAALCGAVTIVARRGAGAFYEDVPLGEDHKVSPVGGVVDNALTAVARVLGDTTVHRRAQDGYRQVIRRERATFDAEVARVFLRGIHGDDR